MRALPTISRLVAAAAAATTAFGGATAGSTPPPPTTVPVHIVAPNPQAKGWSTLFAPKNREQLAEALDGVSVFKLMINCVTNRFEYCAQADWSAAVETLQELNVTIGIEAGMFQGLQSKTMPNSCNGTQDALDDLSKIAKLLEAGGRPLWWTMDSVFQHTFPYPPDWPGWQHQAASDCCNFSVAEAAEQAAAYAAQIRARLPDVNIGLNEPVPWYSVTASNGTIFPAVPPSGHVDYGTGRDVLELIDAFNTALQHRGEPPAAYFHADQPVEYSIGELCHGCNGYDKLGALQMAVEQRGMQFGKYFNSQDGGQQTDELFHERTLLDVRSYAAYNSDRLPHHVIVESWFPLPSRLLPASDTMATSLSGGKSFFSTASAVRRWVDKKTLGSSEIVKQQQWSHHTARLAAVQLNASWNAVPEPQLLGMLEGYIGQASADMADLVVFPEYILGSVHPVISDRRVRRIAGAAAKGKINVAIGCWALASTVNASVGCPGEACAELYSNAVLIINRSGHLVGMYNKTHSATGGPPFFWPPGQGGEWTMLRGDKYPVFDLDFARIGVITCYDGYFPEPARAMSLQGAELLLWPNGRQGMLEPYLISSFLFHNTMHVVATVLGGQGTAIAECCNAWTASVGQYSAGCQQPGDCYASHTVSMDALRTQRKHNRELHQRRPELASVLSTDWATTGFYDSFEHEVQA